MPHTAGMLLLAMVAAIAAPAAADHPIASVISLIEKLEVEAHQEEATEAESYQKFEYWCKRSTRMLSRSIKKSKKLIGELTDKINGLGSDIVTGASDLEKLAAQLETLDKQAEAAKAMRAKETTLFGDEVASLDGSIVATDSAIEIIEEDLGDAVEQKLALAQTGSQHKARKAALRGDPADLLKLNPGAGNPFKPKARSFETNDGGIIDTFKGLEDGWSVDKLSEEEQETNAINAYNLAKQARDTAIRTASASKSEKESIKADQESEKANAESLKAETERTLAGDSVSFDDTDAECKTKQAEHNEIVKVRTGEIEAMKIAVKILSKVSGVKNPDAAMISTKSLVEFSANVQADTSDFVIEGSSFLQIDDPRAKAAALLVKAALKGKSKALQRLAKEITGYTGPFDKIKAMMQKMIFQLMGEQKDEDEHKNWCDMELEKSTESKEDKEGKVNTLSLKVAEMDTAIKLLVKQITENNKKAASITSYQKEEKELRDSDHAEAMATIKDATDAQAALTEATNVLKDYYKDSGIVAKEPWEFLQTGSRTGNPDGANQILTILDETLQKFTTMEADAKVADETDQKAFEQDMAAKKIEIDEANMDTQMKTAKKQSLQEKMDGSAKQLKGSSSELDAVEQYLKDLAPACGTGEGADGAAFEERKSARNDEINALRKAQGILEDAFRAKAAFLEKK